MHLDKNQSNLAPLNLKAKTRNNIAILDKEFTNFTIKQKENLIKNNLRLSNSKGKRIRKITISAINDPQGFPRLDHDDGYQDLKAIKNLEPIQVARVAPNLFVIVDGHRRFSYLKKRGESKIEAEIIGTAECISQLLVARAKALTQLKKPLSIPEMALGLVNLRKKLISEFGKKAFNSHGGDRKSKEKSKASIVKYISKLLNIKIWLVRALLNFGLRIGTDTIAALQNYPGIKELPIRTIQQINPRIKEANLQAKIIEHREKMLQMNASQDEINNEAANMVFTFIRDLTKKNKQTDNSESDNETESSTFSLDVSDIKPPPKTKDKRKSSNEKDTDDDEDNSPEEIAKLLIKTKKLLNDLIIQLKGIDKAIPDKKNISNYKPKKIFKSLERLKRKWIDFTICISKLSP